MSKYLHLARPSAISRSGPLRGPSLVSGKAARRSLGARAAAELLRYDWAEPEPHIDQDVFFDDQFERRSHELQRTPSGENALSIVPQKTGPWSGFNQLGQEKAFAPDANNLQTALKLDEWGFPERWTLALGLDIPDSGLPAGGFDVTALVEFGAGGVTQRLEMDWLAGASITIPMNALTVVAQYSFGRNEGGDPVLPEGLRLRTSLSRGACVSGRATRSFVFMGADIVPLIVPIPPFAKNVSIYPNAPSVGVTPFQFYSANQQVRFFTDEVPSQHLAVYAVSQLVSSIDFANQLVGHPAPLPIPTRARFVAVTSAAGAIITSNNLEIGFQFEIGL